MTAGVIFSVVLSVISYTPVAERNENVLYYSLPELLAMGIVYVVPFFLFLGVPISILSDILLSKLKTNRKARNYLLSVLFYALGGVLATLLLLVLIHGGRWSGLSSISKVLWSVLFASLLFLHVSLLLDGMIKKFQKRLFH